MIAAGPVPSRLYECGTGVEVRRVARVEAVVGLSHRDDRSATQHILLCAAANP
jgi:hypothetical protein